MKKQDILREIIPHRIRNIVKEIIGIEALQARTAQLENQLSKFDGRRPSMGTRERDSLFEMLVNLNPMIRGKLKRQRVENFWANYQFLLEHLPVAPSRNWRVFEAGQGLYGWSDLYLLFFDTVFASDIEDYSKNHPGVISFVADSCGSIPLKDKSIDLLVCHAVLEHVENVLRTLRDFDRILKAGGYVFITVHPLYYSAGGSHVFVPKELKNWEHLDPTSEYYLIDDAAKGTKLSTRGHSLNKMTFSDFMGNLGKLPWSIIISKLTNDPTPIPKYVDMERWSEMDLRTVGFSLLAMKEWHCGKHA